MPTVTYPNGSSLVSSALTPEQVQIAFQTITAQMLGYNPQGPADPAYARVRVEWIQDGQPGFKIDEDNCFIRAIERDESYGKIFDSPYLANPADPSAETCLQTIQYQRTWGLYFTFYGPNCARNAEFVRTGLMLDWVRYSLANSSGLYIIPEMVRPQRTKELYQGRWWPRYDISNIGFNELVTDQVVLPTVDGAEILIYEPKGLVAEIDINVDGYGEGRYGQGPYGGDPVETVEEP